MARPITTRLRYVTAKTPDKITAYLDRLGFRVQIYGAPVFDGSRWVLWFVPPDDTGYDVKNKELR